MSSFRFLSRNHVERQLISLRLAFIYLCAIRNARFIEVFEEGSASCSCRLFVSACTFTLFFRLHLLSIFILLLQSACLLGGLVTTVVEARLLSSPVATLEKLGCERMPCRVANHPVKGKRAKRYHHNAIKGLLCQRLCSMV